MMVAVVWFTRDHTLLDSHSFLRQRYAPIPWWMLVHGIPGVLALFLGALQFSDRLRRRYLPVHRVMGRVYVGSVAVAAPLGVAVSVLLPAPTLILASSFHATAWLVTTGTGLYCVRTGRIQQHRQWMIRSYPFAMVFIVVRAVTVVPAIAREGVMGLVAVVWLVLALAACVPSFVLAWQGLGAGRQTTKLRRAA
jgi:uncharacterized membrane protein